MNICDFFYSPLPVCRRSPLQLVNLRRGRVRVPVELQLEWFVLHRPRACYNSNNSKETELDVRIKKSNQKGGEGEGHGERGWVSGGKERARTDQDYKVWLDFEISLLRLASPTTQHRFNSFSTWYCSCYCLKICVCTEQLTCTCIYDVATILQHVPVDTSLHCQRVNELMLSRDKHIDMKFMR